MCCLPRLAGVAAKPFRQLCKIHGVDLAVSEMVGFNLALWNTKRSKLRRNSYAEESPRMVQIGGANPQVMVDSARYHVALGAQIINIDVGCPTKKVCNGFSGSALMQDEKLATRILERS